MSIDIDQITAEHRYRQEEIQRLWGTTPVRQWPLLRTVTGRRHS